MTREEAIEILIAVSVCDRPILSCDFCKRYVGTKTMCQYPSDKEIEEAVLLLKGASKGMAISALRTQQEHRCPCDLCNFGPPSSMRGKPCTMCPAVPKQETVTERNELTNADRIRAMTDEELAEFLSSIAYGRETPWSEPFAEKFCKSCPTTTFTCEAYHHPMELHECDFSDGKCPHGSDIIWWLQQPAEEDDYE